MPSLPSIQLPSANTNTTTMVTTGSGSNRTTVDTQKQMLLPGHVAVLHVTTCGQSGAGLGSDEKEIVLLIYVIIDVQTNNSTDFTRGIPAAEQVQLWNRHHHPHQS
uniref:Uncharacterized protein n=1 Tax=Anopheles culicifacies TaxID=139723 RepID=A0A182MWD9_9DIPT